MLVSGNNAVFGNNAAVFGNNAAVFDDNADNKRFGLRLMALTIGIILIINVTVGSLCSLRIGIHIKLRLQICSSNSN